MSESNSNNSIIPSGAPDLDYYYAASGAPSGYYDYYASAAASIEPSAHVIEDYDVVASHPYASYPYTEVSGSAPDDYDYSISAAPSAMGSGVPDLDYYYAASGAPSGYYDYYASAAASIEPSAHVIEVNNNERATNSRLTRRLSNVDSVSDDIDDFIDNEITTTEEGIGRNDY